MGVQVDEIKPESLKVTLGAALRAIEACVVEGAAWYRSTTRAPRKMDADLSATLNKWLLRTEETLLSVYASEAPALRFMISEPEVAVHPLSAMMINVFNRRCAALLTERDALLAFRERVSLASYELHERMARHAELLGEIRRSATMTDELWHKLVADPALASPVARLKDLGIHGNAMWDLIKLGFLAAIGGG
jgi:hypothetical protein